MNKHLYRIDCITNMHVGSGETNYNIIDNEVQKDVVLTDVPAIYASGVKGALREHFESYAAMDPKDIDRIFGKDNAGEYKFFGAKLIARPLRVSDGDSAYILTTAVDILMDFSDFLKGLGLSEYFDMDKEKLDFKGKRFLSTSGNVKQIEGDDAGTFTASPSLRRLLGEEIAVAGTLRDYSLPVVARNALKDGKSENLWYEEVVPHKSVFFFVIMTPDKEIKLKFDSGTPVQFGGNSTIGLGYTTVTLMEGGGANE